MSELESSSAPRCDAWPRLIGIQVRRQIKSSLCNYSEYRYHTRDMDTVWTLYRQYGRWSCVPITRAGVLTPPRPQLAPVLWVTRYWDITGISGHCLVRVPGAHPRFLYHSIGDLLSGSFFLNQECWQIILDNLCAGAGIYNLLCCKCTSLKTVLVMLVNKSIPSQNHSISQQSHKSLMSPTASVILDPVVSLAGERVFCILWELVPEQCAA